MTTSRSMRATVSRRTNAEVLVVAALSATLFAAPRFFVKRALGRIAVACSPWSHSYQVQEV
jgi:hypothetical protein